MRPAHRGREEDQVPHGQDRARQDRRESVGAQLAMFSPLPAGARVSVTHDNGTEFARHTRLRDGLGMDTYFADELLEYQQGCCTSK